MEDYNKLWGEIPDQNEENLDEVVPKELRKLVILGAITLEEQNGKQPPTKERDDTTNTTTIGPEHSTMEENVLYTIELIQHARKVTKLIEKANLNDFLDGEPSEELEDCPPMPIRNLTRQPKNKGTFPLQHVERNETPFTLGEPLQLPHLGKTITKEILYKSVGTICAHAGFDTAMQSPLQVLTDVAEAFYKKFTTLLRLAVDKEALYGNSGFPDVMERVFHEIGFGSMTVLHDFYQTRVLKYRDDCEAESLSLVQQYQALLPPVTNEAKKVVRFNPVVENDENIPELHFPAMEEGDSVGELQASLEPGFQILHDLEQQPTSVKNIIASHEYFGDKDIELGNNDPAIENMFSLLESNLERSDTEGEYDMETSEEHPQQSEMIQPGTLAWNCIVEAIKNFKSSE